MNSSSCNFYTLHRNTSNLFSRKLLGRFNKIPKWLNIRNENNDEVVYIHTEQKYICVCFLSHHSSFASCAFVLNVFNNCKASRVAGSQAVCKFNK